WDRPLGLIELREREDNEPLINRRARLKGQDPYAPREPSPRKSMFNAPVIAVQDEEVNTSDDGLEETLADRSRRLKTKKELDEVMGEENVRVVSQVFSEGFKLDGLTPAGGSK